jgi:hypothetical protein
MAFGKVSNGGKKKQFKLVDGSNVFAVMPPAHSLAEKGYFSVFYKIEWGYKNSQNHNKPFQDCRVVNYKTKMVEVESAAHVYREQLNAQKAAIKEYKDKIMTMARNGQATADQVQQAVDAEKKVVELCKQFNLEKKHYLNVMNLKGEVGLLKIGHKAKLALDAARAKLLAEGVESIGLTGVFFDFNKSCATGNFQDITTTVNPYQENIQAVVNGAVVMVKQNKTYDITNMADRVHSECWELANMYPVLTSDQIDQIVKGGPAAVDVILAPKTDKPAEVAADDEDAIPSGAGSVAAPVLKAPVMPTMPTMPVMPTMAAAPAPTVEQAIPAAMAATGVKETVQTPVMPVMPVMPSFGTTLAAKPELKQPVISANVSNEDFLASLGIKS